MSEGLPDELDPRARLHHADGTFEYVRREDLKGLDDFLAAWQQNTNLPHEQSFSAWQMVDEDHPVDGGVPGYRIVYKTVRTVFGPELRIDASNLFVRFGNYEVTWGETRFPNAMPHRREGQWMVPQWGGVEWNGGGGRYTPDPDREIQISAHQETTPHGNFVELLYRLPNAESLTYAEKLTLGRSRTGPLTAAMDLLWGERILGPLVTEEVGAVFDDWHWNRLMGGPTVMWEGQAAFKNMIGPEIDQAIDIAFKINREQTEAERDRIRTAAQWYWRADRESDPVMRYLSYWLCVEAVALEPGGHKIGPVKTMVAAILDTTAATVSGVGRLYNIRSEIAHGHSSAVTGEAVAGVRAIAEAVLSRRVLGRVSPERVTTLRRHVTELT